MTILPIDTGFNGFSHLFQRTPISKTLSRGAVLFLASLLISSVSAFAQDNAITPDNSTPRTFQPPLERTHSSADKYFSFEFSPLLILIGYVRAEFGFAIHKNIELTGGIDYWNFTLLDTNVRTNAYSVGVRYSLDQVNQDGWYLMAQLSSASAKATSKSAVTSETLEASASSNAPLLGGGYTWHWDHFFTRLGFNVVPGTGKITQKVRNSSGSTEDVDVSLRTSFGLVFNIGWAF